jgi:hypothetical protein
MKSWTLCNVRSQRKETSVISSLTVSTTDETDELPNPCAISDRIHSGTELPRPQLSMPDIADTGRISFGAAMRPSVRR